jgi:hypothetical protein
MLSWSQQILAHLIVLFNSDSNILWLLKTLAAWFVALKLINKLGCLLREKVIFNRALVDLSVFALHNQLRLILFRDIFPKVSATIDNPLN